MTGRLQLLLEIEGHQEIKHIPPPTVSPLILLCNVFPCETGCPYVALDSLSFCFHLASAGITNVYHHTWLTLAFCCLQKQAMEMFLQIQP
jgi:hypothetical protein